MKHSPPAGFPLYRVGKGRLCGRASTQLKKWCGTKLRHFLFYRYHYLPPCRCPWYPARHKVYEATVFHFAPSTGGTLADDGKKTYFTWGTHPNKAYFVLQWRGNRFLPCALLCGIGTAYFYGAKGNSMVLTIELNFKSRIKKGPLGQAH